MSKVYDRVELACLEKIMLKMGFHTHWVEIMIRCVWSVTYAIKINGKPRGNITPTWGLRQGDPLSPYLFLLCVKSLLALLLGQLKGIAMCVRGPKISHLFANDSLIFY